MESRPQSPDTSAASDLRLIVARNVRRYRGRMQLSQEAFAARCGLHRTYVGSVERAERNVTLSTLATLAAALEVSVIDLLRDDAETPEGRP